MKAIKLASLGVALMLAATVLPGIATGAQIQVRDFWGTGAGEWNLYNSGVEGGSGSGIMEYLYGVGNFKRLDDSTLQLWTASGTTPNVGVDAVYAGAQQNLYTADPSGSPFSPILSPSGNIGGTPARFLNTQSFTPVSDPFIFLDWANGNQAFSDSELNVGGTERMVAFSVNGFFAIPGLASSYTPFNNPTFVLAFEDGADFDYQDLVVEVSGVNNVPDGGMTVSLLGLSLGALAMLRRRFVA